MARNQTFSVSLNLLTKNFNKGIKSIQGALSRLRSQFNTFAGGIGLGLGLNELIDNAKNLDKVQTTLKNVSGSYEQFGENMNFVQRLANKYNQDLITLTGNYAKFYSAASYAGMSLEEQQHIYESLTRASAYFNLTADETNGVFLAIQQMISKGKVSSEELRKQLGERLPGALNLAAKAMGNITTGQLEEMIKSGKLLATDLLPNLAVELDKLTQNLDVNTIQGATNKLKNEFTELVQKLNVGDIYKGFINGLSSGLNYINNNLKKVAETIAIVVGTLALKGSFTNISSSWNKFFGKLNDNFTKTKTQINVLRAELKDIVNNESNNIEWIHQTNTPVIKGGENPEALAQAIRLKKQIARLNAQANSQQEQLNHKLKTYLGHLGGVAKGLLKTIGMQAAYYAISAAISTIITKLVSWWREQNRIKNLVSDTRKEYEKTVNTLSADEGELKTLGDNIFKKDSSGNYISDEKTRESYLKSINRLLGLQGEKQLKLEDGEEKINKAIQDRLALYEKEKRYTDAKRIIGESESRKTELAGDKAVAQKNYDVYYAQWLKFQNAGQGGSDAALYLLRQAGKYEKEIKNINKEVAQLDKIIDEYSKIVLELGEDAQERAAALSETGTGGNTTEPPKTELQIAYEKIQKEHNNRLRALNEQLADEAITQEDYDKALKELYLTTLESIYALDNIDENSDAFAKAILEAAKAYLSADELAKAQKKEAKASEDYTKAMKDYTDGCKKLKQQYRNGLISSKELSDGMFELLEEVVMAIGGMEQLAGASLALANMFKQQSNRRTIAKIGEEETPKLGDFDTTFDYKKTNSEIYQQNADYIREYAEQLDDYIKRLDKYKDTLTGGELETFTDNLDNLQMQLDTLTQKADSFAQAAKFAEVQEDIKELKTQLAEGIFENISSIATAAERLTNSFKSLQETWDDPDASGWEKFLTTFTTIISVIETIVSVVKTFNTVMAIAQSLSLATAAAEQMGIPTKVQDAIATKAQAAAAKELAVAKHMSAAASLPYPANLLAIATTSAALAAAFAAIPQFAKGGIVAGTATQGDRNLIRANSGEMILTKGQQGTLWSMLNGKASSGSGNVEFKIRGTELVGVLNNYSKKISK